MNKLEVEVKSRSLADLPSDRDVQRTIRYALQSACMKIIRQAVTHHWYDDRTGKLSSSFNWKLIKDNGKIISAKVYQDAQKAYYGKFQIQGTGRYIGKGDINLNKNGRFKGYYWTRQKRWVRNPWIRGIEGENIIQNAYEARAYEIRQDFQERLERLMK